MLCCDEKSFDKPERYCDVVGSCSAVLFHNRLTFFTAPGLSCNMLSLSTCTNSSSSLFLGDAKEDWKHRPDRDAQVGTTKEEAERWDFVWTAQAVVNCRQREDNMMSDDELPRTRCD
jgi:hypothetical protein